MWMLLNERFIQRPEDFPLLTLKQVKLYQTRIVRRNELEEQNRRIREREARNRANQASRTVIKVPHSR